MAAADPAAAVARALAAAAPPSAAVHVFALGKAAPAMAGAAERWLAGHRRHPAGGVVVGTEAAEAEPANAGGHGLVRLHGDHPVPSFASRRAADAVGHAIGAVGPDDLVLVLLSGGTSSLIAAPVAGVSDAELGVVWRLLLASGLDIHVMNAVRRRFTRWGGGRLALALAGRAVEVLAVSDVPGDDPATIGSGPCAADPLTSADVERLLQDADLLDRLPTSIAGMLRDAPETVSAVTPGHPALARVRTRIIASNGDAVRGAAARARELGWEVGMVSQPITGPAAAAGARAAAALLLGGGAGEASPAAPRCLIGGGETTVALGDTAGCGGSAAPAGGRCQELALAAARVLAGAGAGGGAALLAAGTDGRDGPTDAAGAVVDGHTWHAIRAAGRDPAADLVCHESHAALGAAGALLRTGPTGTNVMDVVIAVRRTD